MKRALITGLISLLTGGVSGGVSVAMLINHEYVGGSLFLMIMLTFFHMSVRELLSFIKESERRMNIGLK